MAFRTTNRTEWDTVLSLERCDGSNAYRVIHRLESSKVFLRLKQFSQVYEAGIFLIGQASRILHNFSFKNS